jgi:branched-chain amino acid transport system substrate-binding protein
MRAAIVLAVAFVAGCQPAAVVRIGFLGGLSGSLADLGVGGRNGAQLAVDTLNAEGRERYELLVEDDRQDAATARAAFAAFASRDASFVVGPMTSAMAVAVAPEAERLKLVLISPTATTDELSGKADHFFRTAADAPTGARQLAELLQQRGARSLALLMDASNRAYSASFGHAAAAQFRALGGRVVSEIDYRSGPALDYAELARRLAAGAPDAVLLVESPGEAAMAAQQLRRIDGRIVIALCPWAANVQFVQFGGRAVEGAIALQAVNLDSPLPRMREFARRYRLRFGEDPTTPAVQSYEAVMLGATALRRGGRAALRETLAVPGRWLGLDGDIALDAYGDTRRALRPSVVRHARFEALQ